MLERRLASGDQNNSFYTTWQEVHDSFGSDDEIVLQKLVDSAKASLDVVSPGNLDGTVAFLKEVGRADDAKEILQLYVQKRTEEAEFWNLKKLRVGGSILDPDVRTAFSEKYESMARPFDAALTLRVLGEKGGWSQDDLTNLANVSAGDYIAIFKSVRGKELRDVVNGALCFRNIGNADDAMKKITKEVETALRAIGNETLLNRKRVRNLGVDPEARQAGS